MKQYTEKTFDSIAEYLYKGDPPELLTLTHGAMAVPDIPHSQNCPPANVKGLNQHREHSNFFHPIYAALGLSTQQSQPETSIHDYATVDEEKDPVPKDVQEEVAKVIKPTFMKLKLSDDKVNTNEQIYNDLFYMAIR
jgi:hypothetical protein